MSLALSSVCRVSLYVLHSTCVIKVPSNLLEHIQYELLEDLIDAHGQGLAVNALTEVTHPQQFDQLPGCQAVLPSVQLQLVICKLLLTPAAPHGLHQLSQEVLNLRG